MPYQDLVFVPEVGFMPARALGTRENVVVEHDRQTFTGAVVPDRDGVRVRSAVRGRCGSRSTRPSRPRRPRRRGPPRATCAVAHPRGSR